MALTSTGEAQNTSVDVIISTQLSTLQATRREELLKQISSFSFLLTRGLAIRGHTEEEGNLNQLLKLRMEDSDSMHSWVGCDYNISEEPIGLVQLPDTFAKTLVAQIKDVLIRCNLPLDMCRGQAYDRAVNMQIDI